MRKLVLVLLLFFFVINILEAQSMVNLQWLPIDSKKTLIQEKSLCNFQENDFNYQLKLDRSGFQSEEWLPILEITNLNNNKTIKINLLHKSD